MWRETNLFGIYTSPLLAYALAAFLMLLGLRPLLRRSRLAAAIGNPALLQMAVYLAILAGLVTWF